MEGLLDFGEGFISGGTAGAKMSGGNPYATGAAALGMGALSYFGGASNRRLEKQVNEKSLRQMDQDLELGEFSLGQARRADKDAREKKKRQETFGKLLAQYFQRKKEPV